eukprot:1443444-Prymnesium_polylepis.1
MGACRVARSAGQLGCTLGEHRGCAVSGFCTDGRGTEDVEDGSGQQGHRRRILGSHDGEPLEELFLVFVLAGGWSLGKVLQDASARCWRILPPHSFLHVGPHQRIVENRADCGERRRRSGLEKQREVVIAFFRLCTRLRHGVLLRPKARVRCASVGHAGVCTAQAIGAQRKGTARGRRGHFLTAATGRRARLARPTLRSLDCCRRHSWSMRAHCSLNIRRY